MQQGDSISKTWAACSVLGPTPSFISQPPFFRNLPYLAGAAKIVHIESPDPLLACSKSLADSAVSIQLSDWSDGVVERDIPALWLRAQR